MKKIPMLEKFAAQSLVELDGELIFSKEKFAQLIIAECVDAIVTSEQQAFLDRREYFAAVVQYHFGINDE